MIKFGTGGWRAIIADEFTKANIRLVAAGLCGLMKDEGLAEAKVCVGYDRRFLSKEAAHWTAEVLAGSGFHPMVVNRSSPTPLIMFTVKQLELPYGMAVTASHNPAIYNGIKVFTVGGRDADQTVTARIEAQIQKMDADRIPSVDYEEALQEGLITEIYPFNEYIDSILRFVDVDKIKKAHLRIAIDPMYGVSQSSLRTILLTCRCDVDVIHEQHDTLFGGKMPAPSEGTLGLLSNYVLDNHCNLGVATDGDADRLGVIDFLILITGLNNIPSDLFEAAALDGASGLKKVRYITLPMLRNVLCTCLVLAITGALKVFDLPWVMFSAGMPQNQGWLTGTYMYDQTFNKMNVDYGSTIAVLIVVLGVVLSNIANRVFKPAEDY